MIFVRIDRKHPGFRINPYNFTSNFSCVYLYTVKVVSLSSNRLNKTSAGNAIRVRN